MENVKVEVTAQGNELILREGEAPKVFNQKGHHVKTTMSGVKDYFTKRNIAPLVADMHVFQRSAAWVMPRNDRFLQA